MFVIIKKSVYIGGMFMLDKKESAVLKAIRDYIHKNGFSPSLRELCNVTTINSTSTMQKYLDKIESEGYISRCKFIPRGISIKHENR
jgi:repressor LexA